LKTPRDVSSDRLIKHLIRHWDYVVDRQRGSHILVESATPTKHSIPIPERKALGLGLLRSILSQISAAKGVPVVEILRDL
jgi:predicted RNA binding protein YcfA (HicA-like mRNA interferase family)